MKSSIQIAAALFAFACASGAEVYVANITCRSGGLLQKSA